MSIENQQPFSSYYEAENRNGYADNANIGGEWADIGRLREIAGEFCPEEVRQVVSQVVPDDINLESVFASFSQLQNPPGINSGGLILPDYATGLPFTNELEKLFFPDIEKPAAKTDLSSAAQNQFADNSYSDYSFLRDQEFSYSNQYAYPFLPTG